jgi:hypothetical protein
MQYEIGEGVPQSEVDTISEGINRSRTYIEAHLGGDASQEFREASFVKIVATGDGNQEVGGGGSCCTAFSVLAPDVGRIFFDVLNPGYSGGFLDKLHHAAHEYAHVWQGSIGCLSIFQNPMGGWLNEGIGEYVSYNALIDQGLKTRREVHQFEYSGAEFTGELDFHLSELGIPNQSSPIWPGHVGYLAVAELVHVAPGGVLAIRQICEKITAGETLEDAFLHSFGISLNDFYDQFVPSPIPPGTRPPISAIIQLLLSD